MGEVWQQDNKLFAKQLFNEQQALTLFKDKIKKGSVFDQIQFNNVGIKIMRQALKVFQELNIEQIVIKYDWNEIMMKPQLVCYDKNKWKTLQQLANWNKQWNELFSQCFGLRVVHLDIKISWMDDQWVKHLLEGLLKLPNVSTVTIKIASKDQNVWTILDAFKKANLFKQFQYQYEKL